MIIIKLNGKVVPEGLCTTEDIAFACFNIIKRDEFPTNVFLILNNKDRTYKGMYFYNKAGKELTLSFREVEELLAIQQHPECRGQYPKFKDWKLMSCDDITIKEMDFIKEFILNNIKGSVSIRYPEFQNRQDETNHI